MKLFYNGFDLATLGELSVTWNRDYEGGEAPQRARVAFRVVIKVFERAYADNYALLRQAQAAVAVPNRQLTWVNDETAENYVDQPAVLAGQNFPEEWGTYFQRLELTFQYQETLDTSGQNLLCTFTRTGATEARQFDHVTRWVEAATLKRFSPLRSLRETVQGRLTVEGLMLGDTTLPLAERRLALAQQVRKFRSELNSTDGRLTYGDSANAETVMFDRVVRIESFEADVDQAVTAIRFRFTASYTLFPNEADYATCEATAEEKDGMTGETFLTVSGKVQAATEAGARAKATSVAAAFVKNYGYDQGQQLEWDTTPNRIDANSDGVTFTELSFSGQWRKWRASNQQATFAQTGNQKPVAMGEIRTWDDGYRAERFDQQRSERRHATGTISATGVFRVDAAMKLADRRAALLKQQRALKAECNSADGRLKYGDWVQVVRIEDFNAKINQAETGVEWTLSASYSLFPNEGGYVTCEFSAEQRDEVETGDQFLIFAGEIRAPNGSLARAKLAALRTTTLAIYGYTASQRLRGDTQANEIAANGDRTAAALNGGNNGMETNNDVAGVSFLRLTFNEEYRRRTPGTVVSSKYQILVRDDTATGLTSTTYAGTVTATGATVSVALAAASVRAQALGANKEGEIDSTAFLRSSQWSVEKRQLTEAAPEELVSLTFSYDYQSKLAAGRAYVEVATAVSTDSFGADAESVTGSVVARDEATATAIYQQQVRTAYKTRLIRTETTTFSRVLAESAAAGAFKAQMLRLEFNFTAHSPKPAGRATAKYAMSVSRDFMANRLVTHVRGSVFAATAAAAAALITTLFGKLSAGQQTASERSEDYDYTPEQAALIKLDFDDTYEGRLTGIKGVNECQVTVTVKYSGTRWVVQPLPYNANGSGGVSIVQPGGQQEGGRTVRGSVTAATLAEAEQWALAQRTLLTGDSNGNHYPLPPELEYGYEFAPRVNGIVEGTGENVRLCRVNFTFGEILPSYPLPD